MIEPVSYVPPAPDGHVTCVITQKGLEILRQGKVVGIVRVVNDKPTIFMDGYKATDDRWTALTMEDIDIIMDNWNVMQELGGVIKNAVDKLPATGKLVV